MHDKPSKELLQQRRDLLEKHKATIDAIQPCKETSVPRSDRQTVILTGSSGSLGSFMLDTLLSLPNINHIYCLNRSKTPQDFQIERNRSRSLPTTFPNGRVSFLTADLTKPNFNIAPATYTAIHSSTTLVIHNAWPVNFLVPLSYFDSALATLPALLEFAATSPLRPHLHFISSLGAVINYQSPEKRIPARIIPADDVAGVNQYSHSKHVSELLLAHAAEKLPNSVSISLSRVGQIAGAANRPGLWNIGEWMPRMIISSMSLGVLPEKLGILSRIDWMPVDELGKVVVQIALGEAQDTRRRSEVKVYQPMNPTERHWRDIIGVVIQTLQDETGGKTFDVVPLPEWIMKVRSGSKDSAVNPAMRLLDMYEGMVKDGDSKHNAGFDVQSSLEKSSTLRHLEGVGVTDEWVEKWIREWARASRIKMKSKI